jgi:hypothetical protein
LRKALRDRGDDARRLLACSGLNLGAAFDAHLGGASASLNLAVRIFLMLNVRR